TKRLSADGAPVCVRVFEQEGNAWAKKNRREAILWEQQDSNL
ncbi:MAG: hypothetical protein RL040_1347, partial [Bacteroidota bacterium]